LAIKIICSCHYLRQGQAFGLYFGALCGWQAIILFRHRHADALRQVLDRFDEAEAGVLDQETDCGTVRTAAKAVIELFGRTDGEAGRFFVMKRAQAHVVGATLLQLHVASHHVDDVDAVQQILNEGLWDHSDYSYYSYSAAGNTSVIKELT
jgi:hypothetical protein